MSKFVEKLAAAVLGACLLCSCSGEAAPQNPGGEPSPAPVVQSEKSSIFGRSASYNAYTPAAGAALPLPAAEIAEMAQIDKSLYFLGDGALYALSTETGEGKKLLETPAAALAAHGESLFLYLPETLSVAELSPDGEALAERSLPLSDADRVDGLWVSDSYFIVKCVIKGEALIETEIRVFSRETGELTLQKTAPETGLELFPYKGDKLLAVTHDAVFVVGHLGEYDLETGKIKRLCDLPESGRPAVAYCPATDTAAVFGADSSVSLGDATVPSAPITLTEYSLENSDKIVLDRRYIDVSYSTKLFVFTCENVISAISGADEAYRPYDCLNPPESLVILGYDLDQSLVSSFESETGILVRLASTDKDKLIIKLMAGDSDFDIFTTASGFHNFVDSGAYVDLKTVDSLAERISSSPSAELVVSYDGRYFGVPTEITNFCDESSYPEGGGIPYLRAVTENLYLAKNVDAAEKRFGDPDGDELYKFLKYLNDGEKKPPFGDSATVLGSRVCLLNPNSQNRDLAVRLLEYVFDAYSGRLPGIVPETALYPPLAQDSVAEWRCRSIEIVTPLFEARNEVLSKNGEMKTSELRSLARETAAKIRMRLEE